jgi:hypothetical protein
MKNIDVFSFKDFMEKNTKHSINSTTDNKSQIIPVIQEAESVEPILVEDILPIEAEAAEPILVEDILPIEAEVVELIKIIEKEAELVQETLLPVTPPILAEDDKHYKLYKDINEEFSCDISIEGANIAESYTRIIIETTEWSLVFPGIIANGKCIVPIKKLGILKEGDIGIIKLEVVADGNLFIPWSDTFKIKLSKKVTVNVNEQATDTTLTSGVKVNVSVSKV